MGPAIRVSRLPGIGPCLRPAGFTGVQGPQGGYGPESFRTALNTFLNSRNLRVTFWRHFEDSAAHFRTDFRCSWVLPDFLVLKLSLLGPGPPASAFAPPKQIFTGSQSSKYLAWQSHSNPCIVRDFSDNPSFIRDFHGEIRLPCQLPCLIAGGYMSWM